MLMLPPAPSAAIDGDTDPTELDRHAAIIAAIMDGAAVTDSGDPEGRDRMRFWFVRDHANANPAAAWHDEDGDAYELDDLPYALVIANNQTPPAWRETTAEKIGADLDEQAYFDEDAIEGIR